MSRRRSFRFNRGRIPGSAAAFSSPAPLNPPLITFNTLVTSVTVLQSVQSDLGVTQSGGFVSNWADQSGNGKDYSQATGGIQPAFNANDLNGFPSLTFDGVDDFMDSALVLNAPGTTPTWLWMVIQQLSWTVNEVFVDPAGGATFALEVFQRTATPGIGAFNGTSGSANNGATVGSWARGMVLWNNSTTDYVKFGSAASTTGTNLGNVFTGSGRRLGANKTPGFWANFKIVALMYCAGEPNASEKSALDAAVTAKYGAGVLI